MAELSGKQPKYFKRNCSIMQLSIIFLFIFITNVLICSSKPSQNARFKREGEGDEEVIHSMENYTSEATKRDVVTDRIGPDANATKNKISEEDLLDDDPEITDEGDEEVQMVTDMRPTTAVGNPKMVEETSFPGVEGETRITEPVTRKLVPEQPITEPTLATDSIGSDAGVTTVTNISSSTVSSTTPTSKPNDADATEYGSEDSNEDNRDYDFTDGKTSSTSSVTLGDWKPTAGEEAEQMANPPITSTKSTYFKEISTPAAIFTPAEMSTPAESFENPTSTTTSSPPFVDTPIPSSTTESTLSSATRPKSETNSPNITLTQTVAGSSVVNLCSLSLLVGILSLQFLMSWRI